VPFTWDSEMNVFEATSLLLSS